MKIVFYFRKNVIAKGDFMLANRVCHGIAEKYAEHELICVNYSDDTVKEQISGDAEIKYMEINEQNMHFLEDAILILPFNHLLFMVDELRNVKKMKVCTTFMHPSSYDWFCNQLFGGAKDCNSILELLYKESAYAFMDESNRLTVNNLSGINFSEQMYPVCLDKKEIIEQPLPIQSTIRLRVGWLGRLDNDKMNSVVNFLDNLVADCPNRCFDFYVIGDGNGKSRISLQKYAPQIRFIFTSYLYGEERDRYVRENVDLILAMGISALDTAALGIPTLIPIVSDSRIREDKYVYLFDIKGYALTWSNEILKQMKCKSYSAAEVVEEIFDKKLKQEYGERCQKMAIESFDVENTVQYLLQSLDNTTLTVEKLLKNPAIKRNLKIYDLYKIIRRKKDMNWYLSFVGRISKIRKAHGLRRLRVLYEEVKRTLRK